jgi:Spy/CpxP family protein refolding chaperone
MKTKTKIALLAVLGATALAASAQDNTPPSDRQPPQPHGGDPGGRGGFHLLPPRAQEVLKLTADQKTQIAALEAETKSKLEKILTPAQMQQLKNMHPPMRPDGQGGSQMRAGPAGQSQGNGPGADDNNMLPGPPSGDGDGSAPPAGN